MNQTSKSHSKQVHLPIRQLDFHDEPPTYTTNPNQSIRSQRYPETTKSQTLNEDSYNYQHSDPLSPGAMSQLSNYSTDAASKKENVQVFVRVRPPFENELDDITIGYEAYSYPQYESTQKQCVQVTPPSWMTLHSSADTPKEFQFNQVFNDQCSQQEVFQQTALPLVFHVLNGYNGIYFVYGQTGTGKTHSMGVLSEINEESQGIIPSSIDFIFRFFEEQAKNGMQVDWNVHLSFFQIYQEQIQDLLNPTAKNLQIREEHGEVYVEDLVEVPVKNLDQAMNIINAGLEHRQIASQNMNATSSRSHTILQIDVYQTKQLSHNKVEQVQGRLTLVDLAGSERVRRTTSGQDQCLFNCYSGARLEEAKHINASLSALGNVISGLANQKQQFIPYRSSKLTRVLQTALSGQSKVIVLCTVGPTNRSYQESLGTLQFAQRCKEIQLQPITYSNVIHDEMQTQQMKELISKMERQHQQREEELQHQLRQQQIEIERLKNSQKNDVESKYNMKKVVQIADLTTFLVRLVTKLAENSCQHCNEAYELNQQVKEMFKDSTNSELEQEFPFTMNQKINVQKDEVLDFKSNDEIIKHEHPTVTEMVQKIQKLAKKHVDNINFLSANSKNSVLLKQYVNEHLEDLSHKLKAEKDLHKDNLTVLIKELIHLKKENLKAQNKNLPQQQKVTIEKRVEELREYVMDYVVPMLKIEELTKTQTFEIDEQIFNIEESMSMEQTMERQKSLISDSFSLSMRDQNSKQSNMDAFINFQLLGSVQQENKIIKLERIMPSTNFRIPSLVSDATSERYPHKLSMDSMGGSDDGGVIVEDRKESESSTLNRQNESNQTINKSIVAQNFADYHRQQLMEENEKSEKKKQQEDKMKADKLIILSKGFLERFFFKLQNQFVNKEQLSDSQAIGLPVCGAPPKSKKSTSRTRPPQVIDIAKKEPQFIQKKPKGNTRGSISKVAHYDVRKMSMGSQDNSSSNDKDSGSKHSKRTNRYMDGSQNEQFFQDEMLRIGRDKSRDGSQKRVFYLRSGGAQKTNESDKR